MNRERAFAMMKSLTALITRIERFSELEENWDSYGGLPTNPLAIRTACSFFQHLQAVPTGRGGVQLEYHGEHDIEIVISEKGRITSVCVENMGS